MDFKNKNRCDSILNLNHVFIAQTINQKLSNGMVLMIALIILFHSTFFFNNYCEMRLRVFKLAREGSEHS